MYEFWHDQAKPKYGQKARLCYMDTDSFVAGIKTDDIYKDIAEDVETIFNIPDYELERSLPKGKIEKVIGLMKDDLGCKVIKKLFGLRAKICSYLIVKITSRQ